MLIPSAASAAIDEGALLRAYAEGRAAATIGDLDRAAREYASALAQAPDDKLLAGRALSHAIAAGDRPLALRAARSLEKDGGLAPDGRFLLLTEAVRTRDWKEAYQQLDAIEQDSVFKLLTPVLRAWIAFEDHKSDPLAILDGAGTQASIKSYAAEHRAFLLLAMGRKEEGLSALQPLIEPRGGRIQRLRIAAASELVKKGDKDAALTLLQGDELPIAAARALVQHGKAPPGAIDGAREGIGEFLVRVSADIAAQRLPQIALGYSRLATFLAPDNSETWLVTSDLLAAAKQPDEALKALDNIEPGDPFADVARDTRVRLLAASGDRDAAIARAEAQVKSPDAGLGEWTRLGDLLSQAGRYGDAADAYAHALALAKNGTEQQPEWTLHLLLGGALEQAGRWPEAKKELQAAYKLAPDQAVVLNYLGYSQLSRRENMKEAEQLVRKANQLAPDNAAITDSLGWALFLQGRLKEAIPLLEQAAAGDSGDSAIHEHLGDAYFSAGRKVEARYAWRAALVTAEDKDAVRIREKIEWGLTPKLASP